MYPSSSRPCEIKSAQINVNFSVRENVQLINVVACARAYADELSSPPNHHAEIRSTYVIIDQSHLPIPTCGHSAQLLIPLCAPTLGKSKFSLHTNSSTQGIQGCLLGFWPLGKTLRGQPGTKACSIKSNIFRLYHHKLVLSIFFLRGFNASSVKVIVNFEQMSMQYDTSAQFLLRRRSTPSYVQEPGNASSTKWIWYFKDDNGWKKYAETNVNLAIFVLWSFFFSNLRYSKLLHDIPTSFITHLLPGHRKKKLIFSPLIGAPYIYCSHSVFVKQAKCKVVIDGSVCYNLF